MIKYRLKFNDCFSNFDSWFSSSKEYDRIKRLKLITCNICNSNKVVKSLMAPNISTSKKLTDKNNEKRFFTIKKKLKQYQNFIRKNFEYVGDNFTYEARSLHYDKKNKKRGIYGKASLEDVKDLKDEGIETEMIPWINEKDN